MNYYGYDFIRESDLAHHGILGQKWGIRRFQNKDGTLTEAGRKKYGTYGLENRPSKKEIRTERFNLQDSYAKSKISSDQDLQVLSKTINTLSKKYKLDEFESADDADDYYADLREKARADSKLAKDLDDYEKASELYAKKCGKYREDGAKYADEKILKKYGSVASSETAKTEQIKTGAMVIGAIIASPILVPAAIITASVTSIHYKKKHPDVYYSNPDVQKIEAQKKARRK